MCTIKVGNSNALASEPHHTTTTAAATFCIMSAFTPAPADFYQALLQHLERLSVQLNALIPQALSAPDWQTAIAFCYRRDQRGCLLQPVQQLSTINLQDIQVVAQQKQRVVDNTARFVAGYPANNVLLTGARGTGKSSLIKACLNHFAAQGLRLIEIDRNDMCDLPQIMAVVHGRPERFIIFCDDLSFDAGEAGYRALKSVLEGSISVASPNVLIYATSNRRHLLPEYLAENLETSTSASGEIHPGESVEEKVSLSERFGLWVSFYPFNQDEYLQIVRHWLLHYGVAASAIATARGDALLWALERGSRSGRVAAQFACDYAGRLGLKPSALGAA